MNPFEYILMKFIGLFSLIDLVIFISIVVAINQFSEIKNWGIKLIISFGAYIVVSEILGSIIRSQM